MPKPMIVFILLEVDFAKVEEIVAAKIAEQSKGLVEIVGAMNNSTSSLQRLSREMHYKFFKPAPNIFELSAERLTNRMLAIEAAKSEPKVINHYPTVKRGKGKTRRWQ